MHRKGAQDKKKAKVFNKLAREITVAAKQGQPDPNLNPRLRNAMDAARKANMPNSRIKSAIDQAAGSADLSNYEEVRYEGRGPGGTSIIIEALTDNRNRTAAEVRMAFTKNSGTLGETNSVTFMFNKIGQIIFPAAAGSFDAFFEAAVEAGAENVEAVEDTLEITTQPADFMAVRDALEKKFGPPGEAAILWKPNTMVSLGQEQAEEIISLIDALEDSDDVQHVYANFEVDDAVMAKLAS